MLNLIDKFVNENQQEFGIHHEALRKAASLKAREYIRESAAEYNKRSNFNRIYPSKGSDQYDCYFSGPRPYNKILYKILYSDEIVKATVGRSEQAKIGYKIDIPMGSYEQYRKQAAEKI
jgi:hypothetical protein